MMRVDIIVWSGSVGGAEMYGAELAGAMQELGHVARLVVLTRCGPACERAAGLGVAVVNIGLDQGRDVLRKGSWVVNELRHNQTDVAILQSGGYLAAALRSYGYGGLLFGQEHGSLLNLKWQGYGLRHRFVGVAQRLADPFVLDAQVAVSEFMAERVRRVPHHRRLVVIPNGVDVKRYSFSSATYDGKRPLRVGFAARLVHGKGLEVLLDAARLLKDSRPGVELSIAGDGPLAYMVKDAQKSGISVQWEGIVQDMPRFWSSVDVCVVPSYQWVESFGMTAVEAMACGRPVIASNAGGLPEVVQDGNSGLLFTPGDSVALTRALRRYQEDAGLVQLHGMEARRVTEKRFAITSVAAKYVELAQSLQREDTNEET